MKLFVVSCCSVHQCITNPGDGVPRLLQKFVTHNVQFRWYDPSTGALEMVSSCPLVSELSGRGEYQFYLRDVSPSGSSDVYAYCRPHGCSHGAIVPQAGSIHYCKQEVGVQTWLPLAATE